MKLPSRILVALSGGADSMCLVHKLAAHRRQYSYPEIHAVTIDHKYRDESALEAQKVGEIVSKWNVDHHIIPLDYHTPVRNITNFELVARNKRYTVLKDLALLLGVDHIATGHNFDDVLETTIQRIRQNSTVFGLVGLKGKSVLPIQSKQPLYVIRPLLSQRKTEIIQYCKDNDVPWFEDKSNSDIFLTNRNLYRRMLKEHPSLEEGIIDTIAKSKNLVENVQRQIDSIQLDFSVELSRGTVSLRVPLRDWDDYGPLVQSRFLFNTLYSVLPMKLYHFQYAKVLKKLIPKINKVPENSTDVYTLLQLRLTIKKIGPMLVIQARRQKPYNNISTKVEPNQWTLFDNRYWIRSQESALVVPYASHIHSKTITKQFPSIKPPKTDFSPLVMVGDNWSLPSHGILSNPIECELKVNNALHINY